LLSPYATPTPPRSTLFPYTTLFRSQSGVNTVTNGVDSKGRKTHSEYTAKFDGQDTPWKGTIDGSLSPDQDAVAWKKIDDYTYELDRKSTRLNSSHDQISYAVFCLKK